MQGEIVIVTAFFSIKREQWAGFQRTDQFYFEAFCQWAHMKNRLIVYVEKEELRDKVIQFRSSLGLADKTEVVLIRDITREDAELYDSIASVTSNPISKLFRYRPKHPEVWNAAYDYIMMMKMWCGQHALSQGLVDGNDTLAWMDFGFNHGGGTFSSESSFDFEWRYEFPADRICLYALRELDDRPIFDVVNSLDTYIMGGILAGRARLWPEFWRMCRESMLELNHCGLVDDEQVLMLMCVRRRPDMFEVIPSDWNMGLYQSGCEHLIVTPRRTRRFEWVHRLNSRRLHYSRVFRYALRVFRYYSSHKFQ